MFTTADLIRGGAVFLDQCSDKVEISGNTLQGPPAAQAEIARMDGLELWGRSITVSSNFISRFWLEGIAAANTFDLKILNNEIFDNNTNAIGFPGGGIRLWNFFDPGLPDNSRRASLTEINGNSIGNKTTTFQGYAIRMDYPGRPVTSIPLTVTIGPNNLSAWTGNRYNQGCYADFYPSLYRPVNPNPHNVQTVGTTVAWEVCRNDSASDQFTPSVLSGAPVSSSSSPQTFTFTVRDSDTPPGTSDYANSSIVRVSWNINNSPIVVPNRCHGFWDRRNNALHLYNDSLTAVLGPLALGSSGSLQNSQCTVYGTGSGIASVSGSDLALNVRLGIHGFLATSQQNVYVSAQDNGLRETGWVQTGTWIVATPQQPPSVVSGIPNPATGGPVTFTFVGRDPNGHADIYRMYWQINNSPSVPPNSCHGFYDRPSNALYLYSDNLGTLYGPLTLGSGGAIQNGQCTVYGSGSGIASAAGTDLGLTVQIGLHGSLALSQQNVYIWVKDTVGNDTGWAQTGTWSAGFSQQPPSVVSGIPSAANVPSQIFAFTGRDPNGYQDIYRVYWQINSSPTTPQNTCHGFYERPSNSLYLYSDNFQSLYGPIIPGTDGTLQNGQCSVYGSGSGVASSSGTNFTLNLNLALQGPLGSSQQNVYLWVKDSVGNDTGWVQTGTWTAGALQHPSLVLSTLGAATGTPRAFQFTTRDPNGYQDIYRIYWQINNSPTIPQNTCHGLYDRASNTMYLYSDDLQSLYGPLTPGSGSILQNGQCTVYGSGSGIASASGADLVLGLNLGLQGSLGSSQQNVYLWVKDNGGNDTGWVKTGTWTAH